MRRIENQHLVKSAPVKNEKLAQAFGAVLSRVRRERGLSQFDFAVHTGIPQHYISKVENGKPAVSFEFAYKVATALGLSIEKFSALVEQELNESNQASENPSEPEEIGIEIQVQVRKILNSINQKYGYHLVTVVSDGKEVQVRLGIEQYRKIQAALENPSNQLAVLYGRMGNLTERGFFLHSPTVKIFETNIKRG